MSYSSVRSANLLTSSAIGIREVLHFIVIIIVLNYTVLNYNLILIRFYPASISIYEMYVSHLVGNMTDLPCDLKKKKINLYDRIVPFSIFLFTFPFRLEKD